MDKTQMKLHINGYMGQREWTEILLPSISINKENDDLLAFEGYYKRLTVWKIIVT